MQGTQGYRKANFHIVLISIQLLQINFHTAQLSFLTMNKNSVETKAIATPPSPLMNLTSSMLLLPGMSVQDVSTISSEYRIGRQNSTLSSLSSLLEARNGGRISLIQRRYSFPEFQSGSVTKGEVNFSKLRKDQIIDFMEREQDGMVLKLIKEIEILKEENSTLKLVLNKRGYTLSHRKSPSDINPKDRSYHFPNTLCTEEDLGDRKKMKRKISQEIPRAMKSDVRR